MRFPLSLSLSIAYFFPPENNVGSVKLPVRGKERLKKTIDLTPVATFGDVPKKWQQFLYQVPLSLYKYRLLKIKHIHGPYTWGQRGRAFFLLAMTALPVLGDK